MSNHRLNDSLLLGSLLYDRAEIGGHSQVSHRREVTGLLAHLDITLGYYAVLSVELDRILVPRLGDLELRSVDGGGLNLRADFLDLVGKRLVASAVSRSVVVVECACGHLNLTRALDTPWPTVTLVDSDEILGTSLVLEAVRLNSLLAKELCKALLLVAHFVSSSF